MEKLNERFDIEEEIFLNGPFWIIADSVFDILDGNFKLLCKKYTVNNQGRRIGDDADLTANSLIHRNVWKDNRYDIQFGHKDWNYFPRGRVGCTTKNDKIIFFINLCDEIFNIPSVINTILKEYGVADLLKQFSAKGKIEYIVKIDDKLEGANHYTYELK